MAAGDADVPAADAEDGTDAWDGDVPEVPSVNTGLPDGEGP